MKLFMILLTFAPLVAPASVVAAEVCGEIRSYNKSLAGHFATISLQDGTTLPVVLGQSGEAMIVTSIASGLTVCLEERQSSAGAYYEIGSISK